MFLICVSAACSGRERINVDCDWTGDAAFQMDLRDRTHQQHLGRDTDLAEDLAIRYADAYVGRIGIPEWREAKQACMTRLFAVIASRHGVSRTEIRRGLGRRSLTFDLSVALSFFVLFGLTCRFVTRRLFRAWSFRGWLAVFAIGVMSVAGSAFATGAGAIWAAIFEVIRLGNEHVNDRAARIPWNHYLPNIFVAALALFWLIAWRQYQAIVTRGDVDDRPTADGTIFR